MLFESTMLRTFFFFLSFCLLSCNSFAIDKNAISFKTPIDENRFQELIKELRCMVCPNQPLSESNAELAQDLRDEVREMVMQGQTNNQIKDYLVQRYGDMVLYRPQLKAKTFLLWLAPAILAFIGFIVLFMYIRRQAKETPPSQLTEEEQKILKNVLDKSSD